MALLPYPDQKKRKRKRKKERQEREKRKKRVSNEEVTVYVRFDMYIYK